MLQRYQYVGGKHKDYEMNIGKEIYLDLFLARIKAQSQQKFFDELILESAFSCGAELSGLRDVVTMAASERTFAVGDGVAIFDLKSTVIQKPLIVMSTLEAPVPFDVLGGKPTDIIATVFSPQALGPLHLQRLAFVSRILKSKDLRMALRDAPNADSMSVLFMPTQDWMVAA